MKRTIREWQEYIVDKYFQNKEMQFYKWAEAYVGRRDKTVVHIPARSGSTRVKNKNIHKICGLPLIAYSIGVAKALPVDRVIVNTDSEEYAAIAREYGAEVPFIRPPELSTDTVPTGLASYYAKRHLVDEGYPLSLFIEMYPTTPFRNVSTVRGYLEVTHTTGHCITCIAPEFRSAKLYTTSGHMNLQNDGREMDANVFFKATSSFQGVKINPFEKTYETYVMIKNPIEIVDIDTREDLALAEYIIENRLYDFGVEL